MPRTPRVKAVKIVLGGCQSKCQDLGAHRPEHHDRLAKVCELSRGHQAAETQDGVRQRSARRRSVAHRRCFSGWLHAHAVPSVAWHGDKVFPSRLLGAARWRTRIRATEGLVQDRRNFPSCRPCIHVNELNKPFPVRQATPWTLGAGLRGKRLQRPLFGPISDGASPLRPRLSAPGAP